MISRLKLSILLLVCSLLLSLTLAELFIRYTGLDPAAKSQGSVTKPFRDTFQFDTLLGWSHRLGVSANHTTTEFNYDFHINSFGMRSPELEKVTTEQRIAVIGDSFAWGYGVNDQQRFTSLLEAHSNIPILNFGLPSYGPTQYLLLVPKVIEFAPKLVILEFCLSNDWLDAVSQQHGEYYQPYARLNKQKQLQILGYPIPNATNLRLEAGHILRSPLAWLENHLALVRLIQQAKQNHLFKRSKDLASRFHSSFIYFPNKLPKSDAIVLRRVIAINHALIHEIKVKLEQAHIRFVILAAPTKCEYSLDCGGEILQKNENSLNALNEIALRENIPIINPISELDISDFYKEDTHWNAAGNLKIARSVERWLTEHPN